MRERRNFTERAKTLTSTEVQKKYFLVCEGEKTEVIYFNGIIEQKNKLGISPLVELIPIIRSYSEEGWSNPKKILERIQQNILETEEGYISYETLLNWIMDFLDENILNSILASYIWASLETICEKNMHVKLSDKILNEDIHNVYSQILEKLKKITDWCDIIDNFPRSIESRAITYDKNLDKICFIIDRDKESFISKPGNDQYDYVLNKCRENNFGFYLSNPCFEFWLLMHFDEVVNLDVNQLLSNPKITAKRRYAEDELRKLLPGYSKSKYSIKTLLDRVEKAIENEKKFCEDENQLKDCIGSRVGVLIDELKKQ